MNIAKEFASIVWAIFIYATEAENTGAPAADKKKAVVAKVMADLKDPGGIEIKSPMVLGVIEYFLPMLVDIAVAQLNKAGLFS
jgi:hypothetical protein